MENSATEGADLNILNDLDYDYLRTPVNLFNNDFDQSPAGTYIQIPFPIDPSNLNNVDPLFVDPVNGDFHLQAASPCINVGDNLAPGLPATDKDGFPRIANGIVDMGAYEYQGLMEPVAAFSGFPRSGIAPLDVDFSNESTGTITSWQWEFGDGSTSDQQHPSHTYNNAGMYTVSLSVIGPLGTDTETKDAYITVVSPDAPDLSGRLEEFHLYQFGERIKAKLEIKNTGNMNSDRFNVTCYLSNDGINLGELIDEETVVSGLGAGQVGKVSCKYDSEAFPSGKYIMVLIDSNDEVLETEETNNVIKIRIP